HPHDGLLLTDPEPFAQVAHRERAVVVTGEALVRGVHRKRVRCRVALGDVQAFERVRRHEVAVAVVVGGLVAVLRGPPALDRGRVAPRVRATDLLRVRAVEPVGTAEHRPFPDFGVAHRLELNPVELVTRDALDDLRGREQPELGRSSGTGTVNVGPRGAAIGVVTRWRGGHDGSPPFEVMTGRPRARRARRGDREHAGLARRGDHFLLRDPVPPELPVPPDSPLLLPVLVFLVLFSVVLGSGFCPLFGGVHLPTTHSSRSASGGSQRLSHGPLWWPTAPTAPFGHRLRSWTTNDREHLLSSIH